MNQICKGGLIFEICENNCTAKVIDCQHADGDVFIPKFISHKNCNYLITSINDKLFNSNHSIKSISFSEESEVQSIGSYAFAYSSLEKIIIPSKVKKIGELAFYCCLNLKTVIFQENSELQILDESLFSCSTIEDIIIPSSVTKICSKAFDYCTYLKSLQFQPNSSLQTIERLAFSQTLLENLTIPSKVTTLEEGWCQNTNNLNFITISPLNDNFSFIDNKILISKIDEKSEVNDFVTFVRRDVDFVFIPSQIKSIGSFSFSQCRRLKCIEFEKNSELCSIRPYAFNDSSICRILIPSKVTELCECCFSYCNELKFVEFEENSELKLIDKSAFSASSLVCSSFPSSVIHVEKFAFLLCVNLEAIEFLSEKLSICELAFQMSEKIALVSFPNAKEIKISRFSFYQCSEDLSLFIKSGVKFANL